MLTASLSAESSNENKKQMRKDIHYETKYCDLVNKLSSLKCKAPLWLRRFELVYAQAALAKQAKNLIRHNDPYIRNAWKPLQSLDDCNKELHSYRILMCHKKVSACLW